MESTLNIHCTITRAQLLNMTATMRFGNHTNATCCGKPARILVYPRMHRLSSLRILSVRAVSFVCGAAAIFRRQARAVPCPTPSQCVFLSDGSSTLALSRIGAQLVHFDNVG
jgi:hypothetical protein